VTTPVETTVYLQLVQDRRSAWRFAIRVGKVWNRRSTHDIEGVVLKLRLRLPKEAFEPLSPSAIIEVPADHLVSGADIAVTTEVDG
jgi:hypothetical protein